jgi:translocator protein
VVERFGARTTSRVLFHRFGSLPVRRPSLETVLPRRSPLMLALFLLLTVGGGLLIGWLNPPGTWYASLVKPSFNPPNWLFGPVWTVLYAMVGIGGWRLWRARIGGWPARLWTAQLALNFLWSPVFFGWHRIGLGLAIIVALLAVILLFIGQTWRRERVAALLFLPYAAWVAFASLLNGAIFQLNEPNRAVRASDRQVALESFGVGPRTACCAIRASNCCLNDQCSCTVQREVAARVSDFRKPTACRMPRLLVHGAES